MLKNTINNKKSHNLGQENTKEKPQSSTMKQPTMGPSPATGGGQGQSKDRKPTLSDAGKTQIKLTGAMVGPRKSSRSTSRSVRMRSVTRAQKPKETCKSRSHRRDRVKIFEGESGVRVKKEMLDEKVEKKETMKRKREDPDVIEINNL